YHLQVLFCFRNKKLQYLGRNFAVLRKQRRRNFGFRGRSGRRRYYGRSKSSRDNNSGGWNNRRFLGGSSNRGRLWNKLSLCDDGRWGSYWLALFLGSIIFGFRFLL